MRIRDVVEAALARTGFDRVVQSHRMLAATIDDDVRTVLDVGCGDGHRLQNVLGDDSDRSCYGVDIYGPDLRTAAHWYNGVIRADGTQLPVVEGGVDCIVALDFIEHLQKERGQAFLSEIERAADKQVIVFTPVGFQPQEPYDGNEFQRHRSGWTPAEFRSRGYDVLGANGLGPFRGRRGDIVGSSRPVRAISYTLTHATQALAYTAPSAAYQMVCHKRLD